MIFGTCRYHQKLLSLEEGRSQQALVYKFIALYTVAFYGIIYLRPKFEYFEFFITITLSVIVLKTHNSGIHPVMQTTTRSGPSSNIIHMDDIYFNSSSLNIIIAVFLFLLGTIIVALNTPLCIHYYKRNAIIYEKLFLFLSAVDATTGLAALLQSATFVGILTNCKTFVSVVLTMTSLLSSVSFHVSVFYNVLLAVCRTITLASPFFSFHLKILYAVSAFYPVLMIMLTLYEVISVYSNYPALVDRVMFLLISPLMGSEMINNYYPTFSDLGYFLLLLGIPFVLPSLICLVCCICAAIFLKKNSRNDPRIQYTGTSFASKTGLKSQKKINRSTNSRATVTILELSATFFICNTLYFTTEFTLQAWNPEQLPHETYLVYVAANFLPFLNSLINPLILIYRGANLRTYIKQTSKDLQTRFTLANSQ